MAIVDLHLKDPLKQTLENRLSIELTDFEYNHAKQQAKTKLARIIEREGDLDGERRKPYYLEQLIYEAVIAGRFTAFCINAYREIKKEMPTAKAVGQI